MDHQVITEELLKAKLIDKLQAVHVEVKDISGGCGQSFEVVIVSNQFEGKPLLQRHRLVNDCLKEEISQIHAFTQKTYSPAQWDKMNSS